MTMLLRNIIDLRRGKRVLKFQRRLRKLKEVGDKRVSDI